MTKKISKFYFLLLIDWIFKYILYFCILVGGKENPNRHKT